MRGFKIISTGWECLNELEQTLASVEMQDYQDWVIHIVDDKSCDEQQERIAEWCDKRDERWIYTLNSERHFAVRNQYEGIRAMNPQDDDVIVFLDLDGDRLAHPGVLTKIAGFYEKGAMMTYGGYVPVPNPGTCPPFAPYPPLVIRKGTYREYTMTKGTLFNHLRTVGWNILRRVPEGYFKWPDGSWLMRGTDYAVMIPCLELVGGNYVCVKETILYYNHAQPHPDNQMSEGGDCIDYILRLPALERMK